MAHTFISAGTPPATMHPSLSGAASGIEIAIFQLRSPRRDSKNKVHPVRGSEAELASSSASTPCKTEAPLSGWANVEKETRGRKSKEIGHRVDVQPRVILFQSRKS